MNLIRNFKKTPQIQPPSYFEDHTAVVGGGASVPIELHVDGIETEGNAYVSLVRQLD